MSDCRQPGWLQGYGLTLVSATAGLLVPVPSLKRHGVVENSEDDTLLQEYAEAATNDLEEATARSFLNKTYDLTLDDWPRDQIEIPLAPVVSVASVTYIDGDGDSQTWASSNYVVDKAREPGRIVPAWGQTWPVIRSRPGAITVRFTAGYGTTAATVPAKAKQAVRLYVGEAYESRELGFETGQNRGARAAEAWRSLVTSLRWKPR